MTSSNGDSMAVPNHLKKSLQASITPTSKLPGIPLHQWCLMISATNMVLETFMKHSQSSLSTMQTHKHLEQNSRTQCHILALILAVSQCSRRSRCGSKTCKDAQKWMIHLMSSMCASSSKQSLAVIFLHSLTQSLSTPPQTVEQINPAVSKVSPTCWVRW